MTKNEFIAYIEGIEQTLKLAGIDKMAGVLAEIKTKAEGIDVEVVYRNYPYSHWQWPYYTRSWWDRTSAPYWYTTSNTAGEFQSSINTVTLSADSMLNFQPETGWGVVKTGDGEDDWEIVKMS